LLISLSSSGRTLSALLSSGLFAVNVLSRKQFELVRRFATGDPRQRFDGVPHETCGGVPVLAGTSAAVVCRTCDVVPVLDHVLLIGTVVRTWATAETPLVLLDARPCTAVSD
jgi:flavin reductase (DIM6/NTAB) family NADH-FMN oxidoreductase RutF